LTAAGADPGAALKPLALEAAAHRPGPGRRPRARGRARAASRVRAGGRLSARSSLLSGARPRAGGTLAVVAELAAELVAAPLDLNVLLVVVVVAASATSSTGRSSSSSSSSSARFIPRPYARRCAGPAPTGRPCAARCAGSRSCWPSNPRLAWTSPAVGATCQLAGTSGKTFVRPARIVAVAGWWR
jgi:hypothetical protein